VGEQVNGSKGYTHVETYGQDQCHSRAMKYRVPRDLFREIVGTVPDRGTGRHFCLELCCGPHQGLRRHARRRGWVYVGVDCADGLDYTADLAERLPYYLLRVDLSTTTMVQLLSVVQVMLGLREEDLCMVWVSWLPLSRAHDITRPECGLAVGVECHR